MISSSRFFLSLLLLCTIPAWAEDAATPTYYKYAHSDAEYTVLLPEAPTVKTIWASDAKVPYLENVPKNSQALGETAVFRRVNLETSAFFDVKITYLKADHDFITGLTQEKMLATINNDLKNEPIENKKEDFSSGNNGLKWATVTGFSVDLNNHPVYNVEHYLTGQQSIQVIRVQYSIEDKTFADDYKKLTDSIIYRPL